MKHIYLLLATLWVAFSLAGCDPNLPYSLEEVKKGVVIDVIRMEGTDGVLSAGVTEGNYKIRLSIPKQQGDYSALDYAQLLCVFTNAAGKTTSKVVMDKIQEFPKEITLDIADIYTQLGLSKPALKETLYLTVNAVLKDGYVISGWNPYSDFNNKAFTGWEVDGRNYSYNVRYPVVCAFVLDDFVGDLTVIDNSMFYKGGAEYPAKGVKISDTELEIQDFLEDTKVRLTIAPTVHTLVVKKQVLYPTYGSFTNPYVTATGTIDACNGILSFSGTVGVDQGTFNGTQSWKIKN